MNTKTRQFFNDAPELLRRFAQTEEDELSSILTLQDLEDFQKDNTQRVRKYPACHTLSLFMKQVASENKSCRCTLISDARDQIAIGREKNSTITGPYCKARKRLSPESIKSLLKKSGKNLDEAIQGKYLWHGRRVLLTDGSTLSMPDTHENQAQFPQPKSQKEGLGFPQLRILVLISLGSGAVIDSAVSPCKGKGTGEQALLRSMQSDLKQGDIVLGDANFENYFVLVGLMGLGVDAVFEKNGARNVDFRTCEEKLGKRDGLFKLIRPSCPEWMTPEDYAQVPEELIVRMVGTKKRIIVTTLTVKEVYPKQDIIDLYVSRWHIELDFRSIKTMMKMDILRCGSPDMVRKEIDVHLLVYNMIRALMCRAAEKKRNIA
ncbi:IS4 family transposase [Parashewanella spongiae]|uniref:IS4 family transposase n=1 Tax=Parashewanella spongiae TaxID=342950 RepID=UPI00105A31C7|nr:IS4 family transposase [Parashewanella spongiae]